MNIEIHHKVSQRAFCKEEKVEKIWLKNYPAGVPEEINPDIYSSLVDVFLKATEHYQNEPAFYNFGETLTFGHLKILAEHFAAFLQQTLNLKKGDRFAIMLPNILQYPVVMFGALLAGLVIVNVNPLYTSDELIHQINDSESTTLIVSSNFAKTVEKALPNIPCLKNIFVTDLGDLFHPIKRIFFNFALKYIHKKIKPYHLPNQIQFRDAINVGAGLTFKPVAINNNDHAFLQYTGGTTGISKGAILTHRNIIANIAQADAWFKSVLKPQREIIITALPLYHIFSLTANCIYFFSIGGLNVLITNPRDLPNMIKQLKKFQFTAMTGVNTLFNALLKDPNFAKLDFSRLHLALGGGMAVQEAVALRWQEVTKTPLLEAYGLTETSPCVTINPPYLKSFNNSIGLPVSSTNICILSPDGQELSFNEPGELAVKGPQVMKSYWHNPHETEKVFTKEGWFLTGDIAMVDNNGFVYLLERKKDMILVSGFNVYPNELEDVIAKLEGVKEVAVIGVPDENSGEVPKVFIVRDNNFLSAERVIQYCREHLTPYKIPKSVEFVSELPKTNVGKILRRSLREQVQSD